MGSEEGSRAGAVARTAGSERWRVPLIASALVLAAGLVLERWGDGSADTSAGAPLIVLGVSGALLSALLAARPGGRIATSTARDVVGSTVLLAVGLPAVVWAASGVLLAEPQVRAEVAPTPADALSVVDESVPHSHAPDDTTHAAPATSQPAGNPELHAHGVAQPEQPLDPATRAELGAQLVVARDVALAYPTVADAEAAGFRKVTTYLPLIGAHYMRFASLVDGFVAAQPEMLLFDGTDPASRIVGLSYFVLGATAPPGFAGPNDHWHQHKGLCLKGTLVVGGERTTEEECRQRGGRKANDFEAWMVHAWVVPGWESPQGVFSPEHSGLV